MTENENILVSVVMCVYNTPQDYLDESVKSVLNQTYTNFELLIVDDCSDKDLYSSELYNNSKINIIRLKENSGAAVARNEALKIAKGKYIAIMDSDDVSLPERIEKQVLYMEQNPDVVVCGTWFKFFGDKSHNVKRIIDDNEYYRACLLFGNVPTLLNPSVMIRAKILHDNDILFDKRLRKAEDYKMWVELSKIGKCTNMHEVLMLYRVHPNQVSTKLRTKDISIYDWIVLKEQYDSIGIQLSTEEEAMLKKDFRSSTVDPMKYRKWLDRIITANKEIHEYNQTALERRVEEQWESKVLNVKNPIALFKLYRQLPPERRKKIVQIEKTRIKNRL